MPEKSTFQAVPKGSPEGLQHPKSRRGRRNACDTLPARLDAREAYEHMPRRFNRPAATGGRGFARYDYKWASLGIRISTKRVAMGALKALYGVRAALAAIRRAEEISGKRR